MKNIFQLKKILCTFFKAIWTHVDDQGAEVRTQKKWIWMGNPIKFIKIQAQKKFDYPRLFGFLSAIFSFFKVFIQILLRERDRKLNYIKIRL